MGSVKSMILNRAKAIRPYIIRRLGANGFRPPEFKINYPSKHRNLLLAIASLLLTVLLSVLPVYSLSPSASQLLQQGLASYQADRLTESIQHYQQAIATYHQQNDPLSEALTQRYLALAYQDLGQWEPAKAAIEHSLKLLEAIADQDKTYFEVLAKVLNTQGRHQFQIGDIEGALETWKRATLNYQKAAQPEGIASSLTNQAIALQTLGFGVQAQTTFAAANEALQQTNDPILKAEGARNLGEALRRLGALERSRQVLQRSVATTEDVFMRSKILLELGNTTRAIANRLLAVGEVTSGNQQVQKALDYYAQSQQIITTTEHQHKLQAQLNTFSLLVETNQRDRALQQWQELAPLLQQLPPNRTSIYAQLNASQQLISLQQPPKLVSDLIKTAYQSAMTLQDPRLQSQALGQLGTLYESIQQRSDAQKVTLQALLRIEGLQADDLRYRWEWQLGRLLKQQGDRQQAIAAYTRAIASLKLVRQNLLLNNPDIQFSFRDRVEPIYRDLTDLLLQPDATTAPSQAQLQSAIANIDSLQLAEIENFLRCDLTPVTSLTQDLDRIDPHAAFIYPIILGDRIEVLVRLPNQPIQHYSTAIAQAKTEQILRELRRAVLRGNASRIIERSKQVYTWLVEPLEADLTQSNIETLVFVLDGDLRNIPMTILYDAKTDQYLVEKPYAIALLPSSQLFDLRSVPQSGRVLGAGITQQLQVGERQFNALNAKAELEQVPGQRAETILLDRDFTRSNLQERLRSQAFSIVHLVTHGNFSSDPENTYLLLHSAVTTNGELLKPDEFNVLLQNRSATDQPLSLLILSACKTAEGDNRATLGLVGLAVRAGARSTLGTLWQVGDESTIALMDQFYRALQQPGMTKAQALHQAQVALLKDERYQNPYYWSPYVLVGNWL
jgi:CHAT domain-containing protein